MTVFNEWYAQQNPDLNPRLDDFHQEARKAYEAGAASQAKPKTAHEALMVMNEAENLNSRIDRIVAKSKADQAAGGLASDKTLRDEFAGRAMATVIATVANNEAAMASWSYKMADAMLKARKTTGGGSCISPACILTIKAALLNSIKIGRDESACKQALSDFESAMLKDRKTTGGGE
jgi:hypothetical protein